MSSEVKKSWFKRHKVLTGIGVLILIAIIASAAGGSSKNTSDSKANASSSAAKSTAKQPTMAKIGQAADDGKFEFTVKSIACGISSVGPNQYLTATAQGQFCKLDLVVKNIGNEQQYFSEDNQKILNSSNQQYSPDTTATLYNSNNSDALAAQINPGNSVEGVLVFDIPTGQTPTTAELHDSALSNGVKVSLQ